MLIIDDRAGSKELYEPLRHAGFPARLGRLDFADVCFVGNGPDGSVSIGVEYKKMEDLIQCTNDSRFLGHQLPGMLELYEMSFLLVQGTPLLQADGGFKSYEPELHRWRRSHSNISLRRLYSTIHKIAATGCSTHFVPSLMSACAWIGALYSFWTKPWGKHSVMPIHSKPLPLLAPSLRQRVAALLPGIGDAKLLVVGESFPNTRALVNARPDDWVKIPGVGKKIAEGIERTVTSE